MTTKMFAVRVSDELEKRFKDLARQTGRTATFYAREALEQHIGDLEEYYAAVHVLSRVRTGEESLTDFEDWEAEYDAKVAGEGVVNGKAPVERT